MMSDYILTVSVPVPIPEIKKFSRWQVFKALFNPHAHFTTCESLRVQLGKETVRTVNQQVHRYTRPVFTAEDDAEDQRIQ